MVQYIHHHYPSEHISTVYQFLFQHLSHPDSRSNPIGGSEPSSGYETINWDSLPFFFFFLELNLYLWVWPKSYNRIKISYTTYTESHLHIQNCTFIFTNQSVEPTCSEPLLVCWPSNMRKLSDVFSCTYKD